MYHSAKFTGLVYKGIMMKITYILPFTCDAGILTDAGPLYWTRYTDRSGGHYSSDGENAEALNVLIRDAETRCKIQAYLDINGIDYDQKDLNWTRKMLHHWKAYDATHGGWDQTYYDTLIRLHADPDFNKWCINNLPVIPR